MSTTITPQSSASFPIQEYRTLSAGDWTDDQLAEYVITTVAEPRQVDADSFLLHSPLEVLARHRLLAYVDHDRRDFARVRLLSVATQTETYGPPIDGLSADTAVSPVTNPTETGPTSSNESLILRLATAVETGDLETVDNLSAILGHRLTTDEAAKALIDLIAPFTSAAGHAPIFLHLAIESDLGSASLPMLRPLLRSLAQFPDWRIAWVDASTRANALADQRTSVEEADLSGGVGITKKSELDTVAATDLFAAIATTPQLGEPGSNFIHPVMTQVDPEPAAHLIGSADISSENAAARSIMRAAALSMLNEPTDHAPYGWTHCLTMPQAVCRLTKHSSDPTRLVAIAATHVVGFRAAFALRALPTEFEPDVPPVEWREALRQDPDTAAAAVWHTTDSDQALITEFASQAAAHHDTHLVKYTLACLDETSNDPGSGRLYLAAAAKLLSWWTIQDCS